MTAQTGRGTQRRTSRWWGGSALRGDSARLEAFSDGVLAIAITLLILEVRVEPEEGESLTHALGESLPQIGAYAASFLQIGIIWANHHSLFRLVDKVDQILLLENLLLLASVSFLPLPTGLIAQHTGGDDGQTAALLYGATLTTSAVAFNLIWFRVSRRGLMVPGVSTAFVRDVDVRYVSGLVAYAAATLLALVQPWLTIVVTVVLALIFLLGPSPRSAVPEPVTDPD
jgi:uncharacterized membrane protein